MDIREHKAQGEIFTADSLKPAAVVESASGAPEFLRLPRPGKRCSVSGLSRSALNALILGPNPPIRSICIRRRGAVRGIRLIVTDSLRKFLYAHLD